ncbi:BC1872 family protein [Paenibacillus graminis]|uniref:Phage ABA sandwich domain-containing protein n=1 Tax=Paenibacillus graminis TaxID=189425 RepID=A0A089NI23_9BACL|nr:hypothetical protein [Paenibacillus graminis]AIQ68699.1 hypothetical protein PGRAT_14565 [Paenibacillus graminis]
MTLTREEILLLPPGRKLDRWIQEHIFKWIPWAEQRGDYATVVYQKPGEREPYMRTQRWEEAKKRHTIIPYSEIDFLLHAVYGDEDWSAEISAAWRIVERLKTTMDVSVYTDGNGKYASECGRWTVDDCNTAPEAICKSALLAVLNL